MNAQNQTQAIQDYLKVIYELVGQERRASTNQIAERLRVTPASVTEMIRKLAETEPPLVDYQKHHGVMLTPAGERIALEIVRHHRLLEMFLYQMLGYSWDEVHTEADRLEHVISEVLEERIALALGDPQLDPHGDPIPSRELEMPVTHHLPLAELRPGCQGVIRRVQSSDHTLLRYLSELGLGLNTRLAVTAYSPVDENLSIQVIGREGTLVLGSKISRAILVEVE